MSSTKDTSSRLASYRSTTLPKKATPPTMKARPIDQLSKWVSDFPTAHIMQSVRPRDAPEKPIATRIENWSRSMTSGRDRIGRLNTSEIVT
ncbi:hypothetical protein [Bradyrhizobium sp. BRP22]|uniref:hypothetical protein n=1 Tax=Bradyrhizobium sp. BRP22 TaxID=2793821 RepID=UPI001CD5C435|nr:hypothetical protein [Bradyrhizobium sp. BRP22]